MPTELDKLHAELERLEEEGRELLEAGRNEEADNELADIEIAIEQVIRKIVSLETTGKLPDPFEILKYLH